MRTADKSEPACGSVRFIVPVHSPATIFGRKRCLSSSDAWCASASTAPMVSIWHSEKAQVGGFPHLGHGAGNHRRHALAADVGAGRHRVPAGFDELPVRLGKAIGRRDLPVGPAAALAVAGRVQRRQHFARETARPRSGSPRRVPAPPPRSPAKVAISGSPARWLSTNRMSSKGAA